MKVFNLSEMSADEARALIARAHQGERVCARFYRRADGKVMTRDCRPGRTRLQRLRMKIAVTLFAKSRRDSQQIHFITGKIAAPGDYISDSQEPMLMGEIAPAPTPEPTPGPGGAPWAPWNTKPTPMSHPQPEPQACPTSHRIMIVKSLIRLIKIQKLRARINKAARSSGRRRQSC
jgi:hypothetical protein